MGLEPCVLDRNKGVLKHLRYLFDICPDTVLRAVELLELDLLAGLFIYIIDKAGEVKAEAVEVDIDVGADVGLDVICKCDAAYRRTCQADEQERNQHEACIAQRALCLFVFLYSHCCFSSEEICGLSHRPAKADKTTIISSSIPHERPKSKIYLPAHDIPCIKAAFAGHTV